MTTEELLVEQKKVCELLYALGVPSVSEDGYGENVQRLEYLVERARTRVTRDGRKIELLRSALAGTRTAIATLPPYALGAANEGGRYIWPIRDELLAGIDKVLEITKPSL